MPKNNSKLTKNFLTVELIFQILVLGCLISLFFTAFTHQNGWGAMFLIIPIIIFNFLIQFFRSFYFFIFDPNNSIKILSFLYLLLLSFNFLPVDRLFGISDYIPDWFITGRLVFIFSNFLLFITILLVKLNLNSKN